MTLLEVDDISIRFGGVAAVSNVSFDVARGEVFTLIGPNGAGKTSILNLISRIYPLAGGRVVFRNCDIARVPPHRIASLGIARTFQNIELFERATVLQNLLIGRHARARCGLLSAIVYTRGLQRQEIAHREHVERVIDMLGLEHYRDSQVEGLPYGVRKVVELGRALALEPDLLLLDEPSSGLNTEERNEMAFWIEDIRRNLGITVVMVEHDMSLVSRVSDRVLALNFGQVIAEGPPDHVKRHPAVVEAYLGG